MARNSSILKTACYLKVLCIWIFHLSSSQTLTSPCNNTAACHNCYISTLGQSDCIIELTSSDGKYSLTTEECVQALWQNSTLLAVDHDVISQSCRGYVCDYGLSFTDLGRTVYRKTCDTECLELTLMRQSDRMVSASETYDDITDTKSYVQTCLLWACGASTSICSAAFDSDSLLCYQYTVCAPFCQTIENKTHDIITKVCHDAIDCGLPPDGFNCTSVSTGSSFSDTTTYTCGFGYVLPDVIETSLTSKCSLHGNWSESDPRCHLVDCGHPTTPINGSVEPLGETTFNQTATYSCDKGFLLSGSSVVSCLSDGLWSASAPDCLFIDCGIPPSPSNGMVELKDGTGFGAVAMYVCNAGYNLIGPTPAHCDIDGTWNETVPSCKVVDCGALFAPTNGMVSYKTGTTDYASLAFYICLPDYYMVGDEWRTCTEDGKWNGSQPFCTIKDCGYLPNPEHGYIDYPGGPVYGEKAMHYCISGFILAGSTSRQCQMYGWDGAAPTCELIDCGDPAPPQNGRWFTPNGTTYGMVAVSQCNEGYRLSSNDNLTCLESGAWSASTVICTEITTVSATDSPRVTTSTTTLATTVLHYIMPCTCLVNKTFANLTNAEVIVMLVEDTKVALNSTWLISRKNTRHDQRWSSTLIGYGSAGFIGLVFTLLTVLDILTLLQNGGICKIANRHHSTAKDS